MTHSRHMLALLLALAACDEGETTALPDQDASFESVQSDPDAAVCRSQCPPQTTCDAQSLTGFPNFADTREQWRARCGDGGRGFPFVIAGSCEGGGSFLRHGTGKSINARYFGADGVFAAMTTAVDFARPPCQGETYWPNLPSCARATVTEVLCGDIFSVGEVLP